MLHKVMMWDAVTPEFQKQSALAYAAYGAARAAAQLVDGEGIPSALVEASLHFGCARVAVRMPFVSGSSPTWEALGGVDETSFLAVGLAEALLWLASRDLLYTDLRPPNVLIVDGDKVFLVDYDDMRIVSGLGKELIVRGVEAVVDAFDRAGEIDFTRYPGIKGAFAAALVFQVRKCRCSR